ncbi:flagellar basal body-associated FliL family protein [Wenxinia saemankumensis]|uniref:Flagellar protein FliL n=1 Tax=Wenxinia saemankumensis TaxID=1447782 RepID=A0A1M6G6E6_9RHOB|nr:flagellar basal body-associated FliL family protein [Wenxinia saemankumensis]SHJ05480.1 Flagellar basal body-associated protein FliL [Wenxinia saemankumensis]
MLRLLIPVLLLLVGTGGGVVGAMVLRPAPAPEEAAGLPAGTAPEGLPPCGPGEAPADQAGDGTTGAAAPAEETAPREGREYFRIDNQFVVPVVGEAGMSALVVASLSLEITTGSQPAVFALEPRLRDALLQVMFDHANLGGFDGIYTAPSNMRALRTALREAARRVVGQDVHDVLITDLVRQDSAG